MSKNLYKKSDLKKISKILKNKSTNSGLKNIGKN